MNFKNFKNNNCLIIILFIALTILIVINIFLSIILYKEKTKNIIEKASNQNEKIILNTPEWDMPAISEEELSDDADYNPEFMTMAIQNAINGMKERKGGPIGAVIVKDGKVVASTSNQNLALGYSFAHAEMCAIREASNILKTRNLEGCQIYTSAQPCIMCESAIANANINKVYYAATMHDMFEYGYDDIKQYEKIREGKNLVQSFAVLRDDKLSPLELKKLNKIDNQQNINKTNSLHIDHKDIDIYGTTDYLDSLLLIAGNKMPYEKTFTLSELENLITKENDFKYEGDYSLRSGGGVFTNYKYTGIKIYDLLKYCGISDDISDDTNIKFVSVDGFSYTIPWREIKNSSDKVYAKEDDNLPIYENVPKILAFASNGVPLVGPVGRIELGHRFSNEDGFVESAGNLGGPIRLIFGQRDSNDSNVPKNLQWIRQIIVGDDEHESVHKERLQSEQALRANNTITVNENEGLWEHTKEPYSKFLLNTLRVYGKETLSEKIYTLSEIENMTSYTVTDTFAASCGIDVFRGIKLRDIVLENLKIKKPSKISIVSEDGYEIEVDVDDVMNGIDSIYQLGKHRDIIIAYAINGKPLVELKSNEGFEGDNGSGPLQLVVENQVSKWIKNVVAIKIGK